MSGGGRESAAAGVRAAAEPPGEPVRLVVEIPEPPAIGAGTGPGRPDGDGRHSPEQLAIVLGSISDGVTVQNRQGRLVYANEAAARLCGFSSPAELRALSVREILDRLEVRDELGVPISRRDLPGTRALAGQAHQAVLRFLFKESGQERYARVSSSPVWGGKGRVELAVNVLSDLTGRMRAEEIWRFLSEASALLVSSLAPGDPLNALCALAVPALADFCAVEVNDPQAPAGLVVLAHASRALSATIEELRRRGVMAHPHGGLFSPPPGGRPRLHPAVSGGTWQTVMAAAETRPLMETLGLRSLVLAPLRVAGQPGGIIALGATAGRRRQDGEDLRLGEELARRVSLALENARAYREAREAVRVRDTFLSIASHELKTPLASLTLTLSGLLRSAREGKLAPDKLVARLSRLEEQGDRLNELINQLLDVAHLNARRTAVVSGAVDLTEVARQVQSRFAERAERTGVTVTLEAAGPVLGRWDRGRVDQILTNLVSNAFKYGAGTPVTIAVAVEAEGVRLSVTDRGPGVAPEDQERIFEQYERAASDDRGLGLGLWIVRELVTAHGGQVSLESVVGQGACFTVWLPTTACAPEG